MKNIYIIVTILFSIITKSQTIIDIRDTKYSYLSNTYYDYYKKDLNNLLNPFQGTYIYTSGNTSFKIVLKKMIKQQIGLHFEDIIIGEYQYIENGIEKINTLSNIDIIYPDQFFKHNIVGNGIIGNINNRQWKCPQCNPNEKRLSLIIEDKLSDRIADLLLRKTIINGKDVIQIKIQNISSKTIDTVNPSSPQLPFTLPIGEFTMTKQ
ncbi:hypothetical protein GCM10022217_20550 [Chryseobacterium ginsenosidimutans]|uniref:DUF6705 family protein n=1 Tax=Chryseobacterium ginsenosidimutans TaxID=687846 RepID=UPI0031D66A22